jgi:hypothetical protein
MRELVLVHGRSQQHKDPVNLKKAWLDALAEGLAKIGLTLPVAEESVRFPYYGDTLIGLMEGRQVSRRGRQGDRSRHCAGRRRGSLLPVCA